MRVQNQRTDELPLTWELPAGLALTWILGAVLSLPVGQGIAYLLVGQCFVWPGQELAASFVGLLSGRPGQGLPATITGPAPSPALVYACAALMELAVGFVAAWGLAWWWRSVGPGAQHGLASRYEVEAVLGRRALRRRRRTIRPDLGGAAGTKPFERSRDG